MGHPSSIQPQGLPGRRDQGWSGCILAHTCPKINVAWGAHRWMPGSLCPRGYLAGRPALRLLPKHVRNMQPVKPCFHDKIGQWI